MSLFSLFVVIVVVVVTMVMVVDVVACCHLSCGDADELMIILKKKSYVIIEIYYRFIFCVKNL